MIKKFRGISKEKAEFVYGSLIMNDIGRAYISSPEDIYRFTEITSKSISQYIGKQDKNGREIYEGCILHNKTLGKSVKIEFNNFMVNINYGYEEKEYISVINFDFSGYEILGFSNELID